MLMSYLSVLMFRCPKTGSELSTGIEMDVATFELERLEFTGFIVNCNTGVAAGCSYGSSAISKPPQVFGSAYVNDISWGISATTA